ncbi:hypothetical protein AYO44_13180 [Planctomycetaceae bacterium SCGC AG-212-F19]|nr:hypothetical protein AYO44_13180 [Planctomycetaceae bacterium SCGC AG-212-F19]
MKVTFSDPPVQLLLPWGSSWFDAAKELAAERGLGIVAVTVARRVMLGNGRWSAVALGEQTQQWELRPEDAA